MLAIEDIDAAFDGRKKKAKVTFSALLNCLDGLFYKDELITIITTNHIEKLDKALIRPGRVDLKLEITNPGKDEVEEYLSIFYSQTITIADDYASEYSMAEIMNFCITKDMESCLKTIMTKKLKVA